MDYALSQAQGSDVPPVIYGNDFLDGGDGNDVLLGGGAGDILYGEADNDVLVGDGSSALFIDGSYDSIIGTADKATVQDWYLGSAHHVEQIRSGDNKVLLDTQVETLVQAMAGFAPPPMEQMDLSAAYAAQLAPVLAANWA